MDGQGFWSGYETEVVAGLTVTVITGAGVFFRRTLLVWWQGIRGRRPQSFTRAQDERELMDELWLQAGIEAYGAKDAARRMEQLVGKTRLQVLDLYFAENPEIKRWVDRNIEAGTCNQAASELREKRERLKHLRQEQRGTPPQARVPNPDFEWLHRAAAAGTKVQRGGKT